MTARESKHSLSRVHNRSVDNNETAILISNPQESQIHSRSNLGDGRPNLIKRESLGIDRVFCCGIQTESLQEAQLERDLTNELKRGHVVDMDSTTVSAE